MSKIAESKESSKNEVEQKQSDEQMSSDDTCVVCFKTVEIYSIGECDHPVCYECSTRMRVLCQQNECPICRQVLAKVIFTDTKLLYRELETKYRSDYYNKKYKIGFHSMKIQQAFFALLDHPCPKCDAPPYRTFIGLKNHVRKEHDLHYCDLCTEHLKIFTFERRCYTQAELGLHRTKGDADNRSHRGHPLCEYCNKRYLDRDELFRHLRIDHYFCHFCDADGFNEFYRDYDALAQHFRQDHYLCEEGKCATEQFIGAFRTEIDYKAHIAKEHADMLNKHQAKQTRTLQLEITLGPRARNVPDSGVAKMRGRGNDSTQDTYDEPSTSHASHSASQNSIVIDAHNEQDFPSLGGGTSGPSVSLVRPPPQSMVNRSAVSGLARTKENFPALGGGGGGGPSQRPGGQAISSIVRKSPATSTGAIARTTTAPSGSNGMVLHVSNRPQKQNGGATTSKKSANEFPALPSSKTKKQNRLEEDMVLTNSHIPMTNVSAKHRSLVDDYVAVVNPTDFQKIQMVQKDEASQRVHAAARKAAPKLTTEEFPSLGKSSGASVTATQPLGQQKQQTAAQWIKSLSEKKQREAENRKAKVAPMPLLPKDNKVTQKKTLAVSETETKEAKKEQKKQKEKKGPKENNNNKKTANNEGKLVTTNMNGPELPNATSTNVPPGFHATNVTVNSVAKSPNSLTFTSSLGESYSILPARSYMNPPNSVERNKQLVNLFKESMRTPEAFEEFRCISMMFRDGDCKPESFYEHCHSALGEIFDDVFPELVALLPDITRQQDLYLVHVQRLKGMTANQRKSLPKLEVCTTCKQVLVAADFETHLKSHNLNENFPTLSGRSHRNT